MITYYKLWDKLCRAGKKRKDLRDILSPSTVGKLARNEIVTTESIDKICTFLHCQPGDLMEYTPDSNGQNT